MKNKIFYSTIWLLLHHANMILSSEEYKPPRSSHILIINKAYISCYNEVILTTERDSRLEITKKNVEDLKVTPNDSVVTCIYTHYIQATCDPRPSNLTSLACIILPAVIDQLKEIDAQKLSLRFHYTAPPQVTHINQFSPNDLYESTKHENRNRNVTEEEIKRLTAVFKPTIIAQCKMFQTSL